MISGSCVTSPRGSSNRKGEEFHTVFRPAAPSVALEAITTPACLRFITTWCSAERENSEREGEMEGRRDEGKERWREGEKDGQRERQSGVIGRD